MTEHRLLALLAVPLALWGLDRWVRLSPVWRRGWSAVMAGLLAWNTASILRVVRERVESPQSWDFLAFWVNGRVMRGGGNPYRPEDLHAVALPIEPAPDFVRELLDAGASNLPSSMGLFALVAGEDFTFSHACWYAIQLVAMAGCAWGLARLFLRDAGWGGILGAAVLVTSLRATAYTVSFAQSHFLVLAPVLLAFAHRGAWPFGFWAAIGAVVKPWVALLGLLPLLRRRWGVLGVSVATGLVALIPVVVLSGVDPIATFVVDPPYGRKPDFVFIQSINQSVMARTAAAWIAAGGDLETGRAMGVALALSILAVSAAAIVRWRRDDAALALLVAAACLAYPGSLIHYPVMLLVPVGFLWRERGPDRGTTVATGVVVVAVYLLVASRTGNGVLFANALAWLAVLWAMGRAPDPDPPGLSADRPTPSRASHAPPPPATRA